MRQQCERRANTKNPFRKLGALAQVCAKRLRSLYHESTSLKIGTTRTIQGEEENSRGRDGEHEGHQPTATLGKNSLTQGGGRIRNVQGTQSDPGKAKLSMSDDQRAEVCRKNLVSKSLDRENGARGDV